MLYSGHSSRTCCDNWHRHGIALDYSGEQIPCGYGAAEASIDAQDYSTYPLTIERDR